MKSNLDIARAIVRCRCIDLRPDGELDVTSAGNLKLPTKASPAEMKRRAKMQARARDAKKRKRVA